MKKKIFVSVGTHSQPFDRLLRKIDEIALKKTKELSFFGQIGNCTYFPKNFPYKKFLNEKELEKKIKQSDAVIGHAGAGLIINCLAKKKKLIVLPRLKELHEHTDSHQVDLAYYFSEKKKIIVVFDENKLDDAVKKAKIFNPVIENNSKKIIEEIEFFLSKKN